MRNGRLLASSLRKRLIVLAARLSFFSMTGIRLVEAGLLPVALFRQRGRWGLHARYIRLLSPGADPRRHRIRFHRTLVDKTVWSTLIHNAWEGVLRHNDFSGADELVRIAAGGKGLLMLAMHYGPLCYGTLLQHSGLDPAILASRENIPGPGPRPLQRLLSQEFVFRSTHDGILPAYQSERRFVRMTASGRPGLIMLDVIGHGRVIHTPCLGADYPIGTFAFRLALEHGLPAALLWFTKIRGRGYRLNVRPIHFDTTEEGAAQYGALLDRIVREDPFLWYCDPNFIERRTSEGRLS
jgi:hypothetical protein